MKYKFSYNKKPSDLKVRYTLPEDRPYLVDWFSEPGILRFFPPSNREEVEYTIDGWMDYAKYNYSITALINNKPAGSSILYLNPFKRIAHHSLYGIIVGREYRNQGVGTELIKTMERIGKSIGLEFLHIEVYVGNPAIRLYERLGYKELGRKEKFLKEGGQYIDQIMMQKDLLCR